MPFFTWTGNPWVDKTVKDLFNLLTDNKGLTPYPYQEEAATHLLNGHNVFLCAPTGSGKTWAALLPYLWAKKKKTLFADRLIYVLPLRTLATTLYAETLSCCNRVFKTKTLPEQRNGDDNEIIITIQTGEQKNDPFFEGDIIFTTIDQCLSSYLNCPVSLPQRLGNINAGALLGSLLVFDEFHLLDPDKSMITAIEMMERLQPFAQFAIMTATLAKNSLDFFKGILGGEIVQLTREDVLLLPSHKDKKRIYAWINRPLTIDDILVHHGGKRTIVILNTVARAQNIFIELKSRLNNSSTGLFLLHSRFYPEDRKKTEDILNDYFGKEATKTNVILVTTQVIEAGIDISADNLHTELSPLNSTIQRAGRCARYEGERGFGNVWIYELEMNKKGDWNLGPYRNNIQKILIEDTRSVLKQLPEHGESLDFTAELEKLEMVHSSHEVSHLKSYQQNQHSLRRKVHEAMDGHNEVAVRELIRDVASVNVIICRDPYMLKFDREKWPRMISVPRSSLYKLSSFFETNRDFGETVAWLPVENSNIIDESEMSFGWEPITSTDSISKISWLIIINPEFASYSPVIGLQIGVKGNHEEPKYFERPPITRYKISYETYYEHVQKIIAECRGMKHFYTNAVRRLSKDDETLAEQLETLAEICCMLHDVGKLSQKWQDAVREWQGHKNFNNLSDEPIAHSDYDPELDFNEKIRFPKQPPHSSESAYAVKTWLNDYFKGYAIAVFTAIARHHGAFTESLGAFEFIANAEKWINQTFPSSMPRITLADKPDKITQNSFKDNILNFSKNSEDVEHWPYYVFLVRRIRLADQKSQKGGTE